MNRHIVSLLQQLLRTFQDLLNRVMCPAPPPPCSHAERKETVLPRLYDKREVLAYLRISRRTYDRYKKSGLIVVRRLGRQDFSTEEDLRGALMESIRKGRI